MVMANPPPEANPPQATPPPEADELGVEEAKNVGREFVRQYYTLMHEAPHYLHRFYSHNSSFIHGGVEKPGDDNKASCGQQAIHQKILALNFNDCHAKIRQVDSHPTLGSGVVVQVCGELSNNGEPMRRFMQTFVLAPKCAKRYFVLNDIFRYQDEVFFDEDGADAEEAEAATEERASGNGGVPETQNIQENKSMYFEQEGEPISNGMVQEEEPEFTSAVEAPKPAEMPALETEMDALGLDGETSPMEKEPVEPAPPSPEVGKQEPEIVEPPKAYSWAAMASKNTSSAGATQSAASFGAASHHPVKPSRPAEAAKPADSPMTAAVPAGNPQPQRGARGQREGRFERDRSNASRGEEGEGDAFSGRRTGGGGIGTKYPDTHQLFVGNLPHNISESELKVFFERWGRVVELRINTKSSGGKLPNFGFVVFDSPGPVQSVLQEKPIKFNGEQRLNVEEKKPRGSEGRPIGRGGPRGGGGGGPRGGFSGRGGIKNGNYSRPNEGERRGMGGNNRGGMSGPPRR